MQIAQILAGYSFGEADLLRRAMGKKKKEEMDKQRARFMSGAAERGVSPDLADLLFGLMEKFSGYGFNKSPRRALRADRLSNRLAEGERAGGVLRRLDEPRPRQHRQALGLLPGRQALRREDPQPRREPLRRRLRGGGRRGALCPGRHPQRRPAGHGACGRRAARARAVPRHLRFRRAGRSQAGQQAHLRDPGPRRRLRQSINPNRAELFAAAEVLVGYGQALAADRAVGKVSLFGDDQADARAAAHRQVPIPGRPVERLDEELAAVGFYLSGHPLDDMVEALRRRRTDLLTDAIAKAEAGAEALRMAGVVRRRQERAAQGSGEKFAFVTLSDPDRRI